MSTPLQNEGQNYIKNFEEQNFLREFGADMENSVMEVGRMNNCCYFAIYLLI